MEGGKDSNIFEVSNLGDGKNRGTLDIQRETGNNCNLKTELKFRVHVLN